jgi:hypothetical protein
MGKRGSMEMEIKEMVLKGKGDVEKILSEAKQKAEEIETLTKPIRAFLKR